MRGAFQLAIKYFQLLLLFFLIFQIGRLYFLIYNLDALPNGFWVTWGKTTFHGLRLDFSASAYCISVFLLVGIFEILLKRPFLLLQKVMMMMILIIIVLITLADPELFQKWGNKFNSQVLVYISHPLEMALSAGATNWLKTLLFAIILIAVIFKIYQLNLKVLKSELNFKGIYLILLLTMMSLNFILIRGGIGIATISQSSAIYSDKSIENAAAINSLWNAVYFVFTNSDQIYGKNLNYLSERDANNLFKDQLISQPDTLHLLNTSRPNIIIVMLESFTANASKFFTGNNNHTPFLDSIGNQNLSFVRCYASGDRTEKGLVTVISGYPAQPSSSIIVFPDKILKLPSISKSLKLEGYKNYFFYGGDAEFASMKAFLLVQQFDAIIDKQSFKSSELTSKWGAHDEYLYAKVIDEFSNVKSPFFATIMSLSSHEPFDVPYQDKNLKKDEWYGLKNSIEYADKCVFDFVENCKKQSWYDRTLIVLVADHGHDIGLKGVHYFGPEKYHIPLILTGGALNKSLRGSKIKTIVSQTIIPQLLLTQMGLFANQFYWQTNSTDPKGFAQYHYNNGFGRVSNTQQALFDNDSKKCYEYKGAKADSLLFINQAKAFQQELIKDFLLK